MPTATTPAAPLAGLIVADFSRILAGPLATMTLADLGARVIKVERPGRGDDTRQWNPPRSMTGSTYFESVNRNKESITLDLKDRTDLARARKLALRADILVENFKPDAMESLGLGYPDLARENPGLIYASISGFGTAEGKHLPGYDFIAQAVGGLMSITGHPDGEPTKVGVALVDVLTAKDATIGILAALNQRNETGAGRHLQVNLLSSLQGALANQGQAYLGAATTPQRMGNLHPSIVPYQLLTTADGPLAIAVGNDEQFARLCSTIECPDLASDPRFATNPERVRNHNALVPLLENQLSREATGVWQQRLLSAGIPAGRVANIGEGIDFARSLGLEPTIDVHDAKGHIVGKQIRHPISWNPVFPQRTQAPPDLGEHTVSVLEWLDEDIAPNNLPTEGLDQRSPR